MGDYETLPSIIKSYGLDPSAYSSKDVSKGLFLLNIGNYSTNRRYQTELELLPGFNLHIDKEIKKHDTVIIYYTWSNL